MKATQIAKINPIVEMTSPILLHCRTGECGGCPSGTGKLLWFPKNLTLGTGNLYASLNFQYNFFDKGAEGTAEVKYNVVDLNSTPPATYSSPPNKLYATNNHAASSNPQLSPSLMKGTSIINASFPIYATGDGSWIFFRQPNPAIGNVHDALCFEYNHERRLITFRSF